MGPYRTYKLLHSKKTINKMQRQPTDWEKIFASYVTDEDLIINIQRAPTTQHQKKQTTQLKNGQRI